MRILITGCAGFIGYSLAAKLLAYKTNIIYGLDNLNTEYDEGLKKSRLKELKKNNNFSFLKLDIIDYKKLVHRLKVHKFDIVIHLAAQAGVRKSIKDPDIYLNSNVIGHFNMCKICLEKKVKHFIFASSSSVYGNSKKFPLNESDITDNPVSFYAATKKTNELISRSFSEIYKLKSTGLRFFTVYGEFGRPDMAPYKFTRKIINGEVIELYNKGNLYRDFTYIEDVTKMIIKVMKKPPKNQLTPFQIFNIGSGQVIKVSKFIRLLEKNLNKVAKIRFAPMQQGDVYKTQSNINKINKEIGKYDSTKIEVGVKRFIKWYKEYHKVLK